MMIFWLNFAIVAALATAMSLSSRLLGPKSVLEGEKGMPYETGMRPIETAYRETDVLYYRFAVLFVVFDVDLAFLLPWVWLRGSLTLAAMISMTAFFLLVGFMLAYVWKKGLLRCQ